MNDELITIEGIDAEPEFTLTVTVWGPRANMSEMLMKISYVINSAVDQGVDTVEGSGTKQLRSSHHVEAKYLGTYEFEYKLAQSE